MSVSRPGAWPDAAAPIGMALALPVAALIFPPVALLAGVPLALLSFRFGLVAGAAAAVCIGLVVALISQPSAGFIYALNLAVGLGLGAALSARWPAGRTVLFTMALSLLALGLSWWLLHGLSGFDPATALQRFFTESPGSLKGNPEVAQREQALIEWTRKAQPALSVLSAAVAGFISYGVTRLLLVRRRIELPALAPFNTWRVPWPFAWGYILAEALLLFQPPWLGDWAAALGINLDIIFSVVFAIDGLAVLWFVFDQLRWGWSRYLAALLLLQLGPLIVWAGLFDAWFDFRALWQKKTKGQ